MTRTARILAAALVLALATWGGSRSHAAVDEKQSVVLIRMDFGPGSVFPAPGRPKGQSLRD